MQRSMEDGGCTARRCACTDGPTLERWLDVICSDDMNSEVWDFSFPEVPLVDLGGVEESGGYLTPVEAPRPRRRCSRNPDEPRNPNRDGGT